MTWLSNFYGRPKKPWLGFVLVLFFGPFGFLYHSWKAALLFLFFIGPLCIMFLRGTRIDLVTNAWVHYSALLLLAIIAWVQITGERRDIR